MKHLKLTSASATVPVTPALLGACMEDVNHELYGGIWSQMIYGEAFSEPADDSGLSSVWLPCGEGGTYLRTEDFGQSVTDGTILNRGLNRSGMYFAAGKPYRGYVIARSAESADVTVSLRNADGTVIYAETSFPADDGWTKYPFTLTSPTEEIDGSFAISVKGTVAFGYVFLEPDEWGLYHGLHVRRDVGEALENMGIGLLRFGGSMVNAQDYRWKNMIGKPEDRPHYKGWWYPYSSFGFGIFEFIELCEHLGVVCVPDLSGLESGDDMRDFAQYALGTDPENEWVARRLASEHPDPYKLEYIQFGNEETVNEEFADAFIAACDAVWEVAPEITMVLGDFDYRNRPFDDPYDIPADCVPSAYNVTETLPPRRPTSLHPHERILKHAVDCGKAGKVFIDIHWWCEHGDSPLPFPECAWSLYRHLENIAPGSGVKLCVYELNASAHDFERGMANAYATIEAINHADILPCMGSANCLQVDGHNDNGWNQGLLFMNNRSVWYQAPACMDILFRRALLERKFDLEEGFADRFFNAAATTDGEKISVFLVNRGDEAVDVEIELPLNGAYEYEKTVMHHAKNACNTAAEPEKIVVPDAEILTGEGTPTLTVEGNSIVTILTK